MYVHTYNVCVCVAGVVVRTLFSGICIYALT